MLTAESQKKLTFKKMSDISLDFQDCKMIEDKFTDIITTKSHIYTPFCICVDFETEETQSVTVRDRDTMTQERVKIEDLHSIISKEVNLSNILKKLK